MKKLLTFYCQNKASPQVAIKYLTTFRSAPLPRSGPRRLINLCGRTCYLSHHHLSGCPVDPLSTPSSLGRRYGRQLREACSVLSCHRPVCFEVHKQKFEHKHLSEHVMRQFYSVREREIFIRIKQATKRDMPIKAGAYCLATYQWYSRPIQTKIKQKRKAKGEKCNTKATKTQEYGKYSTMNEYRLSACWVSEWVSE